MIEHYSTCNPNYPEKPEGDKPQKTIVIDMEDGEQEVVQCTDCGAFEVRSKQ